MFVFVNSMYFPLFAFYQLISKNRMYLLANPDPCKNCFLKQNQDQDQTVVSPYFTWEGHRLLISRPPIQ